MLASAGLPLASAWFTKLAIDRLIGHDFAAAAGFAGGLALAGVAIAVLPQLDHYVHAQTQREVGLFSLMRLYAAVDRFVGLKRFENPQFLDRLRLAQQAGGSGSTDTLFGVLDIVGGILRALGFVAALVLLSPVIAVVVIASAVPALLAELALSRRRAAVLWRVGPIQRRELFYSQLLLNVRAAKEVRLFGIGAFLRDRMSAERLTANRAFRRMDLQELAVQGGLGLLSSAVAGLGLWWAVRAVADGRLTIGDLSLFLASVAAMQGAITGIVRGISTTHQALLLFHHYQAVLHAEPDLEQRPLTEATPRLSRGIIFDDVWFRYSNDHPWILRGVNLAIPHGWTVALVGLNGAGKSTLVKLLCRMYDPDRGRILWDGVDLRDLAVDELRNRISTVFQDYMEYDLTVAENIGLGNVDELQNRARIAAAAELAGVHRAVDALPRGYDTLLSRLFFGESEGAEEEIGVTLSGGQWQRLAIARALIRDQRDLLILDEPSSGLDPEAEHEIHLRLKKYRSGRTSLLISHRLGAVRDADIIAVLADGRIIEQGAHDDLIACGGTYARLFLLQASRYQRNGELELSLSSDEVYHET
ncbi:ABC transporter ATP-binding protein [Nonomuraea sp. M3C6]|uniref:ABC transporter ATP-binding protein n=1 Tax=Nonomuraea marmarensis TaxID=3351344 RepID=A0ABW7AVI0_9ACTN